MRVVFDPLAHFLVGSPSGHKIPELAGIQFCFSEELPVQLTLSRFGFMELAVSFAF